MNNSKKRHSGGAYRNYKTMCAAHAKQGKDRAASHQKAHKPAKARGQK